MAYRAIHLNETYEYVSPNDPDKDNPTVWILGVLDSYTLSKLKDIIATTSQTRQREAESPLRLGTFILEVVRFGLKGFKNFLNSDGKEIEFNQETLNIWGRNYQVISGKILELIPSDILAELSDAIYRGNQLSTDERKN